MVNATTELGRMIGKMARDQSGIQENISPDDADAQLATLNSEVLQLTVTLTASSRELATDSFVLDHPVYGELDSPTLKLDGGYRANYILYSGGAFSYPGVYTEAVTQLYTVSY